MTEKYIETAFAKLDTGTHKQKFNILVEIRTKVTKSKSGVAYLIKHGVVPRLLAVLSSDETDKLYNKILDIALSILGNLCMEEQVRNDMMTHDGISVVGKIFCENNQESIQNRSCRTLANLCLSPDFCTSIQKSEVVPRIVDLLQTSPCKENKLTYCRAVRLLGKTSANIDKLISHSAVRSVAVLLKEDEEPEIQHAALRTLYEFSTIRCSTGLASQVSSAGVISHLVQWISHSNNTISNQALKTLFKLLEHSHIRSSFGAAGGITLFLKTVQTEINIDKVNKFSALNVLCMCCKEVVNRVKVREGGALELFLGCLQKEEYHCLHDRIISALQCFMYDDESFDVLLNNGMVPILMKHLKRVAKFETSIPKLHATIKLDGNDIENNVDFERNLDEMSENLEGKFCTSGSHNSVKGEVCDSVECNRPSNGQHVYSIDSPTYQPTAHWQDYSSGVKCKQSFESSAMSPLSITSTQSPLSTISYYSPTSSSDYSPCHSPLQPGTSQVNNNPNYPFVCSIPYSYESPEKEEQGSCGGMSPVEGKNRDSVSAFEYLYSESEEENKEEIEKKLAKNAVKERLFADELSNGNVESQSECMHESMKSIHLVNCKGDENNLPKGNSILSENARNNLAHSEIDNSKCKTESPQTADKEHVKECQTDDNVKPQTSRKNKVYPSEDESDESDETSQPLKRRKTKKTQRKCSNRTEGHILMILARISQMQCSNKYLTKQEIVACLLDYIAVDKAESRAVRLLSRVVRNPLSFEPFLKINLPLMVYDKLLSSEDDDESWTSFMKNGIIQKKPERSRSVSSDDSSFESELTDSLDTSGSDDGKAVSMEAIAGMTLLQDFCLMAETPFGRGVVGHLLAKGDYHDRMNFNISLLYICWNRSMWQHYFFRLNILDELLTTLEQGPKEDPFFQDVLQGFCVLGKLTNINLKLKVTNMKKLIQRPSVNTACVCSAGDEEVSFVMDDGSSITANRDTLSAASPLFAAMLQGHYSESKQKEITLKDTSLFAVRYIVHYLHGCDISCDVINNLLTCDVTSQNLSHALEVLSLSNKYLVAQLQEFLLALISTRFLLPKYASHIYSFAQLHDCRDLMRDCIKAVLVNGRNVSYRIQGFKEFLNGPNKDVFLRDLRTLFKDKHVL